MIKNAKTSKFDTRLCHVLPFYYDVKMVLFHLLTFVEQYVYFLLFLLVNVIITTTLVVIKTQLLLQILNGDDLFFRNG